MNRELKSYETPELELYYLNTGDIVTASEKDTGDGQDWWLDD